MTHASAVSSLEPGELDAAFGRFFIDGAWMRPAGEGRIPVVDPASESVFAEVAAGGPEDVDRAVAAARRAFPAFAATPLAQQKPSPLRCDFTTGLWLSGNRQPVARPPKPLERRQIDGPGKRQAVRQSKGG